MAIDYCIEPEEAPQRLLDFLDLLKRYCPGLDTPIPEEIILRFRGDPKDCWNWEGNGNLSSGYGIITIPDYYGPIPIHRYVYNCIVGVIDIRNVVHHKCENKACWNPFHLEELTPKEHNARHRLKE